MNILEKLEKYKIYLLIPFFGFPILFNSIFIIKNHSYIYLPIIIIFLFISIKKIKKFPLELLIAFTIPLISLLYIKDFSLAFDHYYFFFLNIAIFIIFYNYKYKNRLYNFIIIYSIFIFLYVLYQKFYIYPYLLESGMINEAEREFVQMQRLMGTFSLPNIYAFFSIVGAYLSYFMFNKTKKFYYILGIIINIIAILLTKTFLAFIFLVVLILGLMYKKNKKVFYYSLALVFILTVIFASIRGLSSIKNSFSLRYLNYKSAINIFWDHPISGVGVNNFDIFYPMYKFQEANIIHNAHSMILQSLADLGLLGILFIYFILKNLYSNRNSKHIILLVILLLYFCSDMMFYIPSVAILYWIFISINSSSKNQQKSFYSQKNKIKTFATAGLLIIYFILSIMVFITPDRSFVDNLEQKTKFNRKNNNYYSYFLNIYQLNFYYRMDKDENVKEYNK